MQLNYLAPINGTGFGVVGTNLLIEFQKGHEVALFELGGGLQVDPVHAIHVPRFMDASSRRVMYGVDAPSILVWHEWETSRFPGKGKRGVYTFFERDRVSMDVVHQMNRLDWVAVASRWAKRILENCGVTTPIAVVRPGVDPTVFPIKKTNNSEQEPFRLLHIGKASLQKGIDFVIDTFNKAFVPTDEVELYLCVSNFVQVPGFNGPKLTADWVRYASRSTMGKAGKIKFVDRLASQRDVASLMQRMDAGFFPARAEGWNLEASEMAAMGIPVVMTDYSGHSEYIDEIDALKIAVSETETAYEPPFFNGDCQWARLGEPQIESAVAHLRTLSNIRPGARRWYQRPWSEPAQELLALSS